MEIVHLLLLVFWAVPLIVFGTYGLVILYYSRPRKRRTDAVNRSAIDDESSPVVSIVVPTHNEEKIISKKIENLLSLDYPQEKLELIFVDDSNDSTPEIIERYSGRPVKIRLIRFSERMGYSPSMIAGCKAASGKIVVLNDAGSFIDEEAVRTLMAHFSDPSVGAVTGRDVILNVDEQVGKSENFYQRVFHILRVAETNMDSTFYIKGEATAVRKALIEELGTCGETFDTTAGLFIRQKGFKVVYDPEVKFYEYAPSTHSGRIKQKTIRAANLVKVLWRFRSMMFKGEYGKYGWLILPMNFSMLVIAPVSILCGLLLLIPMTVIDLNLSLILWSILGLALMVSLVVSTSFVLTAVEFEYSLLKALFQIAFTKKTHDKIDKIESTRRPMN
ncbi:glycosyltransferase [Candidatus Bathyarchaeota archaeon]|nr:glycosyltransferase [Candidatus Bathyarchaeota archaeon]